MTKPARADVTPPPLDDAALAAATGGAIIQAGRGALTEGTAERDRIFGTDGNEHLVGYGGNDTLEGEAGADTLAGSHGNDVLYGGTGADELHGEAGADTMAGGEGDDKVYWRIGDGNDLITGGNDTDALVLDGVAWSQVTVVFITGGWDGDLEGTSRWIRPDSAGFIEVGGERIEFRGIEHLVANRRD